jgi:hypothetical protein
MSKFKIKLKLQGLDLEVEGSREDIPHLSRNLSEQITGLINPAVALATAQPMPTSAREGSLIEGEAVSIAPKRRKKSARSVAGGQGGNSGTDLALDWVHDPQKWGSPSQAWTTWQKAIWLLYVASKEKDIVALSHLEIAATFNKHFKQAKTIQSGNVARDLGSRKSGKEALVGEDTTKSPSMWFLTEEGRKAAEGLIAGQSNQS